MDWVELRIIVPLDEGKRIGQLLRAEFGFAQVDEDWTVEKRKHDNASLSYAPIPEPEDPKANW